MPVKKIKEYMSAIVLLVVFALLYMLPASVLPILWMAAAIALLGYITTNYHYGYVIVAGSSIFLVFLIFSQNLLVALTTALPFILCGLTLGISYNVKLPPVKTLSIFTVVYVLNLVAGIKLSGNSSGQTLFQEILSSAGDIYREALTQNFGAQLSKAEINSVVAELTSAVLQFSPSFIVIAGVLIALFSFYLFKRILMLRKKDVSTLTDFSLWRAEKGVSIIYFLLLAVSLLAPSGHVFSDALMNMVTVMMFLFFLLGLSLLEHLLKKKLKKSGIRKLILVAVFLFALPFMGLPFFAFSILGALDGLIDYRQKKLFRR